MRHSMTPMAAASALESGRGWILAARPGVRLSAPRRRRGRGGAPDLAGGSAGALSIRAASARSTTPPELMMSWMRVISR